MAGAGISKAGRASQIAAGGYLDDTDTGVLLVLGTQAAIKGAALFHGGGEFVGDSPRLVVFQRVQIPARI